MCGMMIYRVLAKVYNTLDLKQSTYSLINIRFFGFNYSCNISLLIFVIFKICTINLFG